jgi:hypothetical protein
MRQAKGVSWGGQEGGGGGEVYVHGFGWDGAGRKAFTFR